VLELLDGCAPQAIRLVGSGTPAPRAGLFRVARDGRTDVELEAALGEQLGRIGIVTGDVDAALLEARLHGVAAVVTAPITLAPRRTPKDASLVIVLYGSPTSWVADLPTLA
ncbi:MAG: hypothetical protein NT062_28870, partial [Proteobacteria bacterium]|nr:hypothetical protein [Pseudomonadota bacterium]